MERRSFGLTGNQLKILGLVAMTLDHVGYFLLPRYKVLRYIGRIAMPIFAWMIGEGCRYTKNRRRYLGSLAALAFLCQAVATGVDGSLLMNILVTFSLSVLLIYGLDSRSPVRMAGSSALVLFLCLVLPELVPGFRVDYSLAGVLLPAAVYFGPSKPWQLLGAALCMVGMALEMGPMQRYALAALPLLALYNGKRGKARLKYLFYIYYPAHLAVIYLIRILF